MSSIVKQGWQRTNIIVAGNIFLSDNMYFTSKWEDTEKTTLQLIGTAHPGAGNKQHNMAKHMHTDSGIKKSLCSSRIQEMAETFVWLGENKTEIR